MQVFKRRLNSNIGTSPRRVCGCSIFEDVQSVPAQVASLEIGVVPIYY